MSGHAARHFVEKAWAGAPVAEGRRGRGGEAGARPQRPGLSQTWRLSLPMAVTPGLAFALWTCLSGCLDVPVGQEARSEEREQSNAADSSNKLLRGCCPVVGRSLRSAGSNVTSDDAFKERAPGRDTGSLAGGKHPTRQLEPPLSFMLPSPISLPASSPSRKAPLSLPLSVSLERCPPLSSYPLC